MLVNESVDRPLTDLGLRESLPPSAQLPLCPDGHAIWALSFLSCAVSAPRAPYFWRGGSRSSAR